jgi:cytochrome c-type biogenesis protein CcsB
MSFNFFQKNNKIGFIGVLISNFCLTLLLFSRWLESNHFPFTNLFESLLLLCWILTAIHLTLYTFESFKGFEYLLGVLLSPLTLFLNAFATFCLPDDLQKSTLLVPALQSNWLVMHVSVMILSYGFLLCGSLLALGYIICNRILLLDNSFQNQVFASQNATDAKTLVQGQIAHQLLKNKQVLISSPNSLLVRLDNGSYRCIGLGFAFLTLGILSGAVWANEAWGSYWSWDPKETWALITWIIYALYLHVRLTKGWNGEKPSFVAIFGFFSVWLCYLGVNLLGSGLHSYGWFS